MSGFRLSKNMIVNILLVCLIAWQFYWRQQSQPQAPANPSGTSDRRDTREQAPGDATGDRNPAGKFDYYALVLSWSPSFCVTHGDNPQCSLTTSHKPYSFVLHGLWPQYQKGWPQDCPTERPPFVPEPLINDMLDIMPARQLIIHEYKKHGTCSGSTPEAYFDLARRLYTSIQIPARFQSPSDIQTVSPGDLISDFLKSNPALKPDMIAVSCDGGGTYRLKEVHICISHDGKPAPCGRNEVQRKMCAADTMTVPPVRTSTAN